MSMKKQSETQRHNMNFKELVGKRIKLLSMPNDPAPIPIGSEGLVEMVGSEFDNTTQIFVKWDNGRSLILLGGLDEFQVLDEC